MGGLVISVRIVWFPCPGGRGAIRTRDLEIWDTARWCHRDYEVGYDHGDIDAVLEAQRLGVESALRIIDCDSCGRPTCERCVDQTGTLCLACYAEGPGA